MMTLEYDDSGPTDHAPQGRFVVVRRSRSYGSTNISFRLRPDLEDTHLLSVICLKS
jgi:hypothetical protein